MLGKAPSSIAESVAQASPRRLRTNPTPHEWSANGVIAHLRACADVWGGCIETILAEDEPTIRAVNPRTWIRNTDYLTKDFRDSLRAFTAQRADLMAVLEPLTPTNWSRHAIITGAGSLSNGPFSTMPNGSQAIERPHIRQIRRVVEAVASQR